MFSIQISSHECRERASIKIVVKFCNFHSQIYLISRKIRLKLLFTFLTLNIGKERVNKNHMYVHIRYELTLIKGYNFLNWDDVIS